MAVSDRSPRLPVVSPGELKRWASLSGPPPAAAPEPSRAELRRTDEPRPSRRPGMWMVGVLLLSAAGPLQATPAGAATGAWRPRTAPSSLLVARPDACAEAVRAAGAQAARLRAAVPRLDALLLGEIHTSADDHAWQLATLEAVHQQRPRLTLALEMIPAARQPVLDRYAAGRIDAATFLNQVGWQEVWGHNADLYLPLLRWARLRGVPLLALNAEPELVRRVRRQGLAAIPQAEREGIGTPLNAGPAYRRRLEAAWRGHRVFTAPQPARPTAGATGLPAPATQPGRRDRPSSDGAGAPASPGPGAGEVTGAGHASGADPAALSAADANDLQRFLDSQLLRDRAMAERIAAAQRRDPNRLVVALIGRGHLEDGDGVPRQLADLGVRRQLSLTRVAPPEGCGPAPSRARLGAYLESDNGAVWVRRVAPGSPAAAAGLLPGDRVLELNGMAVQHAGQVIRGVRLQPDDAPLRLTIERAGRTLRLELRLPASTAPRQASRDNGAGSGDRSRPMPRPFARPALLALSPP